MKSRSPPNLALLLLALVVNAALSKDGGDRTLCPTYRLAHLPCTCRTFPSADGLPLCHIRCTGASVFDLELLAGTEDLCEGSVHLDLVHSRLDGLPSALWSLLLSSEDVGVRFVNCSLGGFVDPTDEGVVEGSTPGEAHIEFETSKVLNYEWKQLALFRSDKAFTLTIDATPIDSLDSAFSKVAGGLVHHLGIDHSGLRTLGSKQFKPFGELVSLSLQDNQVRNVYRSMFARPAKSLEYIHLNGNLLTSLPADIFADMPALRGVTLNDNHFKLLPAKLFADVSGHLKSIDFRHNMWHCTCELITVIKNTPVRLDMGYCASPASTDNVKVRHLKKLQCNSTN